VEALKAIFPAEVIAAALAVQVITWIFLKRLNSSKPLPDHINLMVGIALNSAITALAGAVALYSATGTINWFNIAVYAFAGGLAGVVMQSPTQPNADAVTNSAAERVITTLKNNPELTEALLTQMAEDAKKDASSTA